MPTREREIWKFRYRLAYGVYVWQNVDTQELYGQYVDVFWGGTADDR